MSDEGMRCQTEVHRYQATATQVAKLRQFTDIWQFWTFDQVIGILSQPHHIMFFISEKNGSWEGALLGSVGLDTLEIYYLYILPTRRGQGHAKRLFQHFCRYGKLENVRQLYLEVRTSNTPAIQLYKNQGMKIIGKRQKYYSDGEDAFIFNLNLREWDDQLLER